MKVLITGSSGFFGKLMTNHLISKSIPVVGVDICESEIKSRDGFRFYCCSITDKEKLTAIFTEEKPTHVIHFASSFNKIRNKKKEYEIDVTGSENVIRTSDQTPSVRQLIYSSSVAAYGANKRSDTPLDENDPLRPGKYRYGINKKRVETMMFTYPLRQDLKVISLRICTVVGPMFTKRGSIVSLLIKFPVIPACCRFNKIQLIHSDDFSNIFNNILEDTEISGIYNFASDTSAIVNDILPQKKYIGIPVILIKSILWILWNLRLLNLQPAGINFAINPVVMRTSKIVSRYNYRFRYTSEEAFMDTLQRNRLVAGSWY